jgi:hypothetical protein
LLAASRIENVRQSKEDLVRVEAEAVKQTVMPKISELNPNEAKVSRQPTAEGQFEKNTQRKTDSLANKKQPTVAKPASPSWKRASTDHQNRANQSLSETKTVQGEAQPTLIVENIRDQFVESAQEITLDSSDSIALEQISDSLSGSLEPDFQLEDLSLDLPSFGELQLQDDSSEAEAVFDEDTELNLLLPDLNELMPQDETEYIGELLVGLIANLAETSQVNEQSDLESESPTDVVDLEPDSAHSREKILLDTFEEELGPYLIAIGPEDTQVIKSSVIELGAIIKNGHISIENMLGFEKGEVEQRVEALCVQLFEALGLNYNASIIEQFIVNIILANQDANFIESDVLSIDRINSLGTHEHKLPINLPLITSLAKLIKQQMNSHLILGRYAILGLQANS